MAGQCSSFAAVPPPTKSANTHAAAQARYRAKNKDAEQEKARERMARLRESRREAQPELRRTLSSNRLRATPLFALFRAHARAHIAPVLARPPPTTPVLTPPPRLGVDEVAACLGSLRLDFKYTDPREVDAFDKLLASGGVDLDDDDIEFMLRHAVPAPSTENLACCSHLV
ncbi:hypothetical protein B0H11DRAFT_2251838 [Mycena galericulata]|nr:hypothetical protein B0H11DRAFT_2251838 [Mycena galericulata]